jgi:hypothetical protein
MLIVDSRTHIRLLGVVAILMLASACAGASSLGADDEARFRLAGLWDVEGSVVEISQNGAEVQGRWKSVSDGLRCLPGSRWFVGRIEGDGIVGWQSVCPSGTERLHVRIVDPNTLVLQTVREGAPHEATLSRRR